MVDDGPKQLMWFVDDDEDFLDGVKWWFRPDKNRDWDFRCFSQGARALKAVDNASQPKPDVAVIDLNLPNDKFDGLYVISELSEKMPTLVLVALTADPAFLSRAEDCIHAGAVQFVRKDLHKAEFWQRVEQAIWIKRQVVAAVEAEKDDAKRVRETLLPKAPPAISGLIIQHGFWPAEHVSGDHYGYGPIGDHELLTAIGDAAGHGSMQVALVAHTVGVCFHALGDAASEILNPGSLLRNINRTLFTTSLLGAGFVTMLVTRIDAKEHRITYASAGHPLPIVFRGDSIVRLDDVNVGPPLNVVDSQSYDNAVFQLQRGDFLMLFTDGVSEALVQAEVGQGDGVSRLADVAKSLLADRSHFPNRLMQELRARCGEAIEWDDRTIITIELE